MAQGDLGIQTPKLLTKNEATNIGITYNQLPDAQAKNDYIQSQITKYGKYWNTARKELEETLPPEAIFAGTLVQPGQEVVRVNYLNAAQIGPAALKKSVSEDVARGVRKEVRTELEDFTTSVLPQAEGGAIAAQYIGQVETLALSYAARGLTAEDAAKKAADDVINKYYEFEGTVRVPLGFDSDRISLNLSQITDEIGSHFDIQGPRSTLAPERDTTEDYLDSIQRTGFWVTNGADTGVFLRDEKGANVLTETGEPVFISFTDLQKRIPARRIIRKGLEQEITPVGIEPPVEQPVIRGREPQSERRKQFLRDQEAGKFFGPLGLNLEGIREGAEE